MRGLAYLFLACIPVVAFLAGVLMSRLGNGDTRLKRDYNRAIHKLANADNLIDDLSIMASEHQQFDEAFAVLALEKIVEYRRERNQI